MTGQEDSEGNRLTSNPETGGHYHSRWLTMIYPRLFLARQLLREDGVIFISIDDHEVHNLRILMNEIFGEENFVAEIVWEGALKNDSRFVSVSHDYIVCYARSKAHLAVNQAVWRSRKEGIDAIYAQVDQLKAQYGDDYDQISSALRQWYSQVGKNHPAWQHRHYSGVDAKGVYFPSDISWPGGGGPTYPVLHPVTGKPVRVPARGWVYPNPKRMQEMIDEDRVVFGPDENKVPTLKRYLHETEGQVLPSVLYKDRRAAMKRLRDLFGADVFQNPKDTSVLAKLIEATTAENDIVLDFFAGSCATAHAVLDLNHADGGRRAFIMVQIAESLPQPLNLPDGTMIKNIADLGAERIRRAISKIPEQQMPDPGQPPLLAEDLGFRAFKRVDSHFAGWTGVEEAVPETYLRQMELFRDPLASGSRIENVLYELALKEGFALTLSIKPVGVATPDALYLVTDPEREQFFYACLADKISFATLEGVALTRDDLFICRDAALDDTMAANLALQCRLKTI